MRTLAVCALAVLTAAALGGWLARVEGWAFAVALRWEGE